MVPRATPGIEYPCTGGEEKARLFGAFDRRIGRRPMRIRQCEPVQVDPTHAELLVRSPGSSRR